MPGWASYNMAGEILNLFYRGITPTIPGTLYLRLLVAASNRSGGGTETNYGGYARKALQRDTASIFTVAPANGRLTNGVVLEMANAATTVGNGDLVAFDIVDTPSGAFTKIYNGGPILPPKSAVVGKKPKFAIGALEITF